MFKSNSGSHSMMFQTREASQRAIFEAPAKSDYAATLRAYALLGLGAALPVVAVIWVLF